MYRKKEGYVVSQADGLPLSVMAVLPEKKPYQGVVQLVHGMSEHKERYLPFMEYLADYGYVSVIHDHRGHGKSVKNQKDLGYMYGGGSKSMLLDLGLVNQIIHEQFQNLPLVLLGHSMGSLAVRAFARTHDDKMDLLIVCGSPSYNPARGLGKMIAGMEKTIFGPRHPGRMLEQLSFGTYDRRFKQEAQKNAWLCSDRKVCREYEASPLCGFTFTDDAYLALFDLMKEAYDARHWFCTNPELPVLFVSGEQDPCMGNVRKFAKAVKTMRKAGYVHVKGKLYPGMRHEILNEAEKEKVYHDLVVYIKKNV